MSLRISRCLHERNSTSGSFLQLKTNRNDIGFVDGELIGELARQRNQKFDRSVKLSRYNNHICYINNINALFRAFRCST